MWLDRLLLDWEWRCGLGHSIGAGWCVVDGDCEGEGGPCGDERVGGDGRTVVMVGRRVLRVRCRGVDDAKARVVNASYDVNRCLAE